MSKNIKMSKSISNTPNTYTLYLLRGSFCYEPSDPLEIVEQYYAIEENAQRALEGIANECAVYNLDVQEIECTEEELGLYIVENEDKMEWEDDWEGDD